MARTLSGGARPAWYDRNAASKCSSYLATAAPHALTARWTYTVPAGKKALVELLQVGLKRMTAAGTPQVAYVAITVVPSGGSGVYLVFADLTASNNAVGDKDNMSSQGTLNLSAGDEINAKTYDGSTTGTIEYTANMKITEFDA
jgi:hypothetical protein